MKSHQKCQSDLIQIQQDNIIRDNILLLFTDVTSFVEC